MADEKSSTEKVIESVNRFNENCFLFDHIGQLVKLNENASAKTPYKNFIMLNDDVGEIVQELTGKKGLEPLFYLTPAQTALLVPKIQIFKVMYKNDKSNEPYEKEFIFNDFTSPRSIENITNNKMTRGDDVGIKSFEYLFDGETSVLGGQVKCKLNLFFQNVQSLLVDPPKGGISFRDLILRGVNTYPTNNSNSNNCSSAAGKSREQDTRSFQIKVVVGWADPVDPNNILMNKQMIEAIRNSKSVLFLNLIKHDINFLENGAVELSLDYIGAMEGVLSSNDSNIFYLTENGKLATKRREKEKQENKNKAETQAKGPQTKPGVIDTIKSLGSSAGDSENEVSISLDPEKRNKKDFNKAVTMLIESLDKQEKYSRLLSALQNSGKLYYTDVEESQIIALDQSVAEGIKVLREKSSAGEDITDDKIREIMLAVRNKMRGKSNKNGLIIKNVKKEGNNAFDIAKQATAKSVSISGPEVDKSSFWGPAGVISAGTFIDAVQGKMTLKVKSGDDREKIVDIGADNIFGSAAKTPEGKRRINFFFLGDLLETVLNVLMSPERGDNYNMKVILGPYVFEDPDTGQKVEYNLADIPISLNLFLTWYMNVVIKPQKETYLLGEFIKDVTKDLIVPVLEKDKCYFDGIATNSPLVRLGFYSVPDIGNGILRPGKRYKLNDLRMGRQNMSSGSKHHDIKNLVHYLFIFISNEDMNKYRGDYEEDNKKGIYHIVLGADRGIVRSIKFSKYNIPLGEEVAATTNSKEQAQGFTGLYNADITMVGNNVFSLGTKLYLDASRIVGFLGDKAMPGTLAHQLKLGGYYEIIRMNNTISGDDNITEITAKWHNSEVGSKCTAVQKMNNRKDSINKTAKSALEGLGGVVDKGKRGKL